MYVTACDDHSESINLRPPARTRCICLRGMLLSAPAVLCVLCVLFFLVLLTLPHQMLYQMSSTDSKGEERHFEKPLFLTFLMFLAMACALPIYFVQQVCVLSCRLCRARLLAYLPCLLCLADTAHVRLCDRGVLEHTIA